MLLKGLLAAYHSVWFTVNGYNIYPLVRSALAGRGKARDGEGYRGYLERAVDLPRISVLIPAYREEKVLERCVRELSGANYPRDRLDLVLLTERDDRGTSAIAARCARRYGAKHVVVRETGEPRGKPRALKQGLRRADGEIVGVIDAEDIIDPDLFRHVAYEIMEKGHDVVQGKLDMANDEDGWLNAQFRAEYGFWYNHYLPHLARSRLPVPLGGTTNFFRRSVLEELDDWDAFNLTEDFELGLRLYNRTREKGAPAREYSVGVFDCVTTEESPLTLDGWIRQRTRWQRGKLQTLRKVLRSPGKGISGKFNSLMACVTPHIAVVNITGILVCLYSALAQIELPLPFLALAYLNVSTIPYYCIRQGAGYLKATEDEDIGYRRTKAVILAVTLPLYWGLQWIADLRAIKQEYFDKTIFWEKTEHTGRNLTYN